MTNERRLSIALENCLRTMTADELKELCSTTVDQLRKSLPKEVGGTKVHFEGRPRGRGGLAVSRKVKLVGSLSVKPADEPSPTDGGTKDE